MTLADKVERALEDAGIEIESITSDEEDGGLLLRVAPEKPRNPIVTFPVYAHTSKDSMYETAMDAGITLEEIEKYPDLVYVGYEIRGQVTFNRDTGEIKEEWGSR